MEQALEENLAYQIMKEKGNLGIDLGIPPVELFWEIAEREDNLFSDYQKKDISKIIKEAEETGLIEKRIIDELPRYFIKN
ncbi:hypothetical protein KAT24_00860 [Candidatus Pacearchaeota archaeon]|nr:hypothetical protein [Candidatus Pacearchaeota archaeon]